MKHIDGRWFLYTPIVVFLLYFGITNMIDYYASLEPKSKEEIINTLLWIGGIFTGIWTLAVFLVACDYNWNERHTKLFIYYTPIVPFTLLIKLWMYIDKFFHKHFTINAK
jgi:hypothetical protein